MTTVPPGNNSRLPSSSTNRPGDASDAPRPTAPRRQLGVLAVALVLALALLTIATSALAAGTPLGSSFTYQGALKQNGTLANGSFDLQFSLWEESSGTTQVGSTLTRPAVNVAAGQLKADLDFGSSAFSGDERWLKVAVRPAGSGAYTALVPLQRIAPAPYALRSLNPGPQGPPGAQGVVTTGFVGGIINPIPGMATWTFAGPTATVTLQPGQRIIAWGAAPLGLSGTGLSQSIDVDVGWQPVAGGVITNASGNNYMASTATTVKLVYPVNGVINPGPGTWRIGVAVRNGPNPLSNNDYVNFTYMIVNQ